MERQEEITYEVMIGENEYGEQQVLLGWRTVAASDFGTHLKMLERQTEHIMMASSILRAFSRARISITWAMKSMRCTITVSIILAWATLLLSLVKKKDRFQIALRHAKSQRT